MKLNKNKKPPICRKENYKKFQIWYFMWKTKFNMNDFLKVVAGSQLSKVVWNDIIVELNPGQFHKSAFPNGW